MLALLLTTLPFPAFAQERPTLSVEASTDDRRRGLSWSDGDASLRGSVSVPAGPGLRLDGTVAALRGSDRHGGADVGVDLSAGYAQAVGPVTVDGSVIGHVFPGGDGALGYVEVGGGVNFLIGPLSLDAFTRYAPEQSAIGGDNLVLAAQASLGIPMTPFTVRAGIGRSSGSVDDAIRAARLRPAGDYIDWTLGVEHVTGPIVLGIDYVDTNIRGRDIVASPFADGRNSGSRLVARAGISF